MKHSEEIIIMLLQQGNEDAYKYIYEHHYMSLCEISYGYVKDRFIAETIVSDFIYHLWEIKDAFNIQYSVKFLSLVTRQ